MKSLDFSTWCRISKAVSEGDWASLGDTGLGARELVVGVGRCLGWFTTGEMVEILAERTGLWSPRTIGPVIHRLKKVGVVKKVDEVRDGLGRPGGVYRVVGS